ncbi:MAG: 3-hydroxyacyl-CoA dehydrogenase NAD-binding domain-containing protein [Phycisphaerales bacterium]|nr:3-hydroxyacyl-CoA dehydrogenase NAD-binding domain-containing protein [Phycisphaerales bacterium]
MKTGIIGSGAMGSGIAQVLGSAGHEVAIFDSNPAALSKSKTSLKTSFDKLAEKGKISNEQAQQFFDNIHYIETLDGLAETELVIEAIVEDLSVKQQVFKNIEAVVGSNCILASNTSSLSIASIAAACRHPERVIGIHFFNPAPLMALVEIIPAVQTHEGLAETVKSWVSSWGKLPVITKDTPGFIVNRVARPFYSEAIRLYEEGFANCATIDRAMTAIGGFKMGPFALMDFIGHDVNYRVTESVFHSFFFDPRFKPSLSQKRLFEAGYWGKKSGRGFYNYAEGAVQPTANEDLALQQKIVNRILAMLINEAADALFLNIASREDLETAMTKGVNYPKGLLAWGDEIGWNNILQQLDGLYHYYHEDRYRASPQIRNWIKAQK